VSRSLSVAIFGAGKVGSAIHRGLRAARVDCSLRAARRGLYEHPVRASLLVLTVRDREIPIVARALAEKHLVTKETAVVHVAGALSAEALAAVRASSAGVAQMHPMIAFASTDWSPTIAGGHAHVAGDREAVRRAKKLCGALGLHPRTFPSLDPVLYHASAGLVANGAAALAAAGLSALRAAGVPDAVIPRLLGPLLRSVADNVEHLGLPQALTGPVRRGDARAVEAHLATLRRISPELEGLYRAMGRAQLPLAREVGDASAEALDEVARVLGS
jgi:predicted short-subunit dehydrogenase-like oxidoreductase (DUF2520 family)